MVIEIIPREDAEDCQIQTLIIYVELKIKLNSFFIVVITSVINEMDA